MRGKVILFGSIFAGILLILTTFPPVVAYQTTTRQVSQQTLSLKSMVNTLSKKQNNNLIRQIIHQVLTLKSLNKVHSKIQSIKYLHQETLSMKSIVKNPPQKQGIIYNLIAFIVLIILLSINFYFQANIPLLCVLFAIFWPISIPILFYILTHLYIPPPYSISYFKLSMSYSYTKTRGINA